MGINLSVNSNLKIKLFLTTLPKSADHALIKTFYLSNPYSAFINIKMFFRFIFFFSKGFYIKFVYSLTELKDEILMDHYRYSYGFFSINLMDTDFNKLNIFPSPYLPFCFHFQWFIKCQSHFFSTFFFRHINI